MSTAWFTNIINSKLQPIKLPVVPVKLPVVPVKPPVVPVKQIIKYPLIEGVQKDGTIAIMPRSKKVDYFGLVIGDNAKRKLINATNGLEISRKDIKDFLGLKTVKRDIFGFPVNTSGIGGSDYLKTSDILGMPTTGSAGEVSKKTYATVATAASVVVAGAAIAGALSAPASATAAAGTAATTAAATTASAAGTTATVAAVAAPTIIDQIASAAVKTGQVASSVKTIQAVTAPAPKQSTVAVTAPAPATSINNIKFPELKNILPFLVAGLLFMAVKYE